MLLEYNCNKNVLFNLVVCECMNTVHQIIFGREFYNPRFNKIKHYMLPISSYFTELNRFDVIVSNTVY